MHKFDKENGLYDNPDYFYYSRRQYGEEIKEGELSIEYPEDYELKNKATDNPYLYSKCMIIVAIFYEQKDAADFLKKVKVISPPAFMKPYNMFIGCRS